ncbi:MAG: shikimate dehydrogenase [Bacilli bacterium]|nr:shikimate dehydrogenase [Bacilli bacterium]
MKYGLIGEKLGHSFSKEIHERIADYKYELCEVAKDDFDEFFKNRDFISINVTIPYKERVIPYLDYIDDIALSIGAVNTVVNKDGKLYGYNTDYYGLKSLIEKRNINVENKKVLILGTGGTSKTATVVVKTLGAKEIIYASINGEIGTFTYEEVIEKHTDAEVIINTTPCGMYPNNDGLLIDIKLFKNLVGVVDVVYNPLLTTILQNAKTNNLKYASGLYMLVSQAVYASAIFQDIEVSHDLIDEVFEEIYFQKQNIVLIGMPTCGKTTIGKKLAKELNKTFVDIDTLIEEEIQMPISEFLNKDNEKDFRDIEEKVVERIAKMNNLIISTGGGVIKRQVNIERLKKNGIVVFIDRDVNLLMPASDRPLSSNLNDLKKLYNERYEIYKIAADIVVKNNTKINDVITKIIEEVK